MIHGPLVQDEQMRPTPGTRGPCNLCGFYEDLTRTHILPRKAGNRGQWLANSYLVDSTGAEKVRKRVFRDGIEFRTLCAECNNSLGGREDLELTRAYKSVRKMRQSQIIGFKNIRLIEIKPNILIRAVLANLVAAEDRRAFSDFDADVRKLFFDKAHVGDCRWKVSWWVYTGKAISIIRTLFMADFAVQHAEPVQFHVLKMKPIAFCVSENFVPNGAIVINNFIRYNEEENAHVPIRQDVADTHEQWPAVPVDWKTILSSDRSTQLIARKP